MIGVSAAINTAVQPHPLYHLHTPRHAMYRRIGRYQHCRPTASTPSPTHDTPRHAMYRRIGRYQHCRPTSSTPSPTHDTPRDVSVYRPLLAFITHHGLSQRAGLVLVCPVLSAHLSGGANSAPPDLPQASWLDYGEGRGGK